MVRTPLEAASAVDSSTKRPPYPGEEPSDTVSFTVTYSNLHGKDGSLVAGQDTPVHDGMILNVHKTDRS